MSNEPRLLTDEQLAEIRNRSTKWMDYAVSDCKRLLAHIDAMRIKIDASHRALKQSEGTLRVYAEKVCNR